MNPWAIVKSANGDMLTCVFLSTVVKKHLLRNFVNVYIPVCICMYLCTYFYICIVMVLCIHLYIGILRVYQSFIMNILVMKFMAHAINMRIYSST